MSGPAGCTQPAGAMSGARPPRLSGYGGWHLRTPAIAATINLMSNHDPVAAAIAYYQERMTSPDSGSHPEGNQHLGALIEHIATLNHQKARTERHLASLVNIGNALSMEKDLDAMLRRVLMESKTATGADAGSIFLVESAPDDTRMLRFKFSHTFSKDLPYEEYTIALNTHSIAGFVAATGRALNIPDVYKLPENCPFSFNSSFDKRFEYRSKSVLVVPMRNFADKVIGVIQLINCKDTAGMTPGTSAFGVKLACASDFETLVVTFPADYELILDTIASQASIALENRRMIWQIEHQFEQFVKASVNAIESRDPVTAGHSSRVAESCIKVAKHINTISEGRFENLQFSSAEIRELEYAALLHDFGKVYLDTSIFLKEKKLFPKDFQSLKLRLSLLYRSIEVEALSSHHQAAAQLIDDGLQQPSTRLATIQSVMQQVAKLNEPSITDDDPSQAVAAIRALGTQLSGWDLENQPLEILSDYEAKNLSIKRGTLTAEERKIIESHVSHSFNFLDQIPWPDDLRNIPDIAHKHHEKLDGSGYPLGICDPAKISIQSRIMTIADIWDALAAADRPYKKAVPFERCCSILREEASQGKLDSDLVEVLIGIKASERAPIYAEKVL